MSEDNETLITSSHTEVAKRLNKTIFNTPLTKGQIILLATETNSSIKETNVETELTFPDTSKFVISNEGRLLSDISTIPTGHVLYEGKPAGYRFDYIYNKAEKGGVIQIGSYVTTDSQIVKDVNRTYFPDGKSATLFYNKKTGELEAPKTIDITDSKGKGAPFSITPN